MGKKRSKVTCKQRKAKAAAHHIKILTNKRTIITGNGKGVVSVANDSGRKINCSGQGGEVQGKVGGILSAGQNFTKRGVKLRKVPQQLCWNGRNKTMRQRKSSPSVNVEDNDEKRLYAKELASLREREANSRQQQNQHKSIKNSKIVPCPPTFHAEPITIQEKILDTTIRVGCAMSIGEGQHPLIETQTGTTLLLNSIPLSSSTSHREWWAAPEYDKGSMECTNNPWEVLGTGDSSSDEEDGQDTDYLATYSNSRTTKAASTSLSKAARPLFFAPPTFKFGDENERTTQVITSLKQEVTPPISKLSISDRSQGCNDLIDPDL
jgi:hypothetical protein